MTERQQRIRMRRVVARGWFNNSRPQALCIAYLEDGKLCRQPASFIDPARGGMVCEEHRPRDPIMHLVDDYPDDWPKIAARIKEAAGWRCERCKHPHDLPSGHVLTVHHLDGQKSNCADWNLAALCQRCHLSIQGRVKMDQLFFTEILDVSEWFRPHLEGYLRSKEQ